MRTTKNCQVEWIGKIPPRWSLGKLKYFLLQNDGGVWGKDPSEDSQNKIVLRSTEQTVDGKWSIIEPAERDLKGISFIECRILPEDLIITKSSGSSLHIGKTTLADLYFESNEFYYSNFLQRLRVQKTLNSKFLWYILNNPLAREQFVWMQNSTIGIGNINAENINDLIIPVPSIAEQTRIVDFLDSQCSEIDALISDIRAQIDILEQYKKSVIYEAVTKGLDPDVEMKDSGVEWIGEIPKSWNFSKFKYVYQVSKAKLPSALYDEQLDDSIPYMTMEYIRNCEVVVPQYALNGVFCQACELLLLWDGANAGEVIYNHPEGFAPSTTAVLSLKNTLCPKFATFYMVFLESIIRNNTKGMGVPHVDSSFLSNLPFFIPSVAEQTLIANHLDSKCSEIDACINEKQEQISTLESYKKSLIYEYVTGKKEIAAND